MGAPAVRLLVIGVDGAAYPLVREWMQRGELPNLNKLSKKGTFGQLNSTNPPITFPAIPSFITGKNPGKHGVVSFFRPNKDGALGLASSKMIDDEVWQIGPMRKRTKLLVNVPLTFPAKKVKGWTVGGLLAPGTDDDRFVRPSRLRDDYKDLLSNYRIDTDKRYVPSQEGSYIQNIVKVAQARCDLAQAMMADLNWDLAIVYFSILDRVQHFMFGKDDNKWVLEAYKAVDKMIGDLVKTAGKDTSTMVFSDHGFGRSKGRFYPNAWLEKNGHQFHKGQDSARMGEGKSGNLRTKLMPNLRTMQSNQAIVWMASKVPNKVVATGVGVMERLNSSYDFDSLDHERTEAFSTINGIYINSMSKKKKQRLIALIQKGLEELELDGTPLNIETYRREEIYSGPCLDKMPDIMFKVEDYSFEPFASFEAIEPLQVFEKECKGWHRTEGIFCLSGPGFSSSGPTEASIMDLAPTILGLFGIDAPEDMDGSALEDAYSHSRADRETLSVGMDKREEEGISKAVKKGRL